MHISQEAVGDPAGPVTRKKDGSFNIAIQAKPGAKQNAITGMNTNKQDVHHVYLKETHVHVKRLIQCLTR